MPALKFSPMDQDSTDNPKAAPLKPARRQTARGSPEHPVPPKTDCPPRGAAAADIDPAMVATDEDDETWLPEVPEEPSVTVPEGPLAIGHAAIEQAVRLAPTSPGVYRMLNAANAVLYVGKAKNVRKRLPSYAPGNPPQPARHRPHIAATVRGGI